VIAEPSWQQAEDFEQMFLQGVRAGKESLVLKDYDAMIRRYDRNSKPAIGLKVWRGELGEKTDVPSSFWHDPETDEIYVSMGGGSGFTILDPWKERSVTYRNKGIWNTTDNAEGVLLREDWTFGSFRNSDPGLLFDLPVHDVLRHTGTKDIVLSTASAGILIIHTGDPATYADDALDTELWWLGNSPQILTFNHRTSNRVFHRLYEDSEGRLYADNTHGYGLWVIHPDLKAVTIYFTSGPEVFSSLDISTPFFSPKLAATHYFPPLFKAYNGDLYLGSMRDDPPPPNTSGTGLTVLQAYEETTRRYTTSVNYRTTGLWNTTEQVGLTRDSFTYRDSETTTDNLITRSQRLPGGAVYHGWEDSSGVVYLGTNNGLALLHPDGLVETVTTFEGRLVYSSFKTPEGSLYLNTDQGIEVWYADGTQGQLRPLPGFYPSQKVIYPLLNSEKLPFWLDREGNLNAAIRGEGVEVYAPNLKGTATSFPVETSDLARPHLRWETVGREGTVRLQSRVGKSSAWYINRLETPAEAAELLSTLDSSFAAQHENGVVVLDQRKVQRATVAWLSLPRKFPAGSTVRLRLQGVPSFRLSRGLPDTLRVGLVFQEGSVAETPLQLLPGGEWIVLEQETPREVERIGLFWRISGYLLHLDELAVLSSEGWAEWQTLPNPTGSPIPQVDKEHPLVQWRALFERTAPSASLPSLSGVWVEGAPEVTAVEELNQPLPQHTTLHPNFPNPFNAQTQIEYRLAEPAAVQLIIYNLSGQPVRQLVQDNQWAGFYRVSWDGTDNSGKTVGSGVYLYHLIAGEFQQTRRLLLLK
jgi:hypothetical protein